MKKPRSDPPAYPPPARGGSGRGGSPPPPKVHPRGEGTRERAALLLPPPLRGGGAAKRTDGEGGIDGLCSSPSILHAEIGIDHLRAALHLLGRAVGDPAAVVDHHHPVR